MSSCLKLKLFLILYFASNCNAWLSCERAMCAATSKTTTTSLDLAKLDKGFNLLEVATGVVSQGQIVKTAKETYRFIWKRMMAELAPQDQTGSYQRPQYNFNEHIGSARFPDVGDGRYHLYVGNPCPWCHRAVLALKLLHIDASGVDYTMLEDNPVKASRGGWVFADTRPDPLGHVDLRALYDALSPGFRGRCTAPLLIDKQQRRIVSNESADIVRMLNSAKFGKTDSNRIDLVPPDLEAKIDETNEWSYVLLNNGVYRCGFSTTQAAYDQAAADVRQGLTKANGVLQQQPFLCGDVFTEADLRLLPTMLRFNGAYAPLFKAGGAHLRVQQYPALQAWLQRCWAMPGVSDSIDLADACASYYKQLFPLNPGGILPMPVQAADLGLV